MVCKRLRQYVTKKNQFIKNKQLAIMCHLLSLWTNADLISIEILNTKFKIWKFLVSNDSHFVVA